MSTTIKEFLIERSIPDADYIDHEMEVKKVRTINRGVTRKVRVQKTFYKSDLIDVAKELFFPDGRSSKGMIGEFSINLFDFQKNYLPDDMSVGELYDKTGLNSLRFYLATKQTNSTIWFPVGKKKKKKTY
ncbi:uncharacterized protein LOC107885560 [Acyrthosiphon pisum]|uniref:Uncharacterized protein n=1 Tax=Acyrthosiphon pisum TaxID=7029 RepID=A0A8R2NUA7_ACYPI|nr:uncharacterized protein LOC107885560 [Acyrthosiphon pisum]